MINVLLIHGGPGFEAPVSKFSKDSVLAAIDRSKYNPVCVHMLPDFSIVLDDSSYSCFFRRVGGDVFLQSDSFSIKIDVAFPIFHGFGEDGSAQGFFEFIGLPYIGNDIKSSAITMDKAITKRILSSFNIPFLPFIDYPVDYQSASRILNSSKLFVKPSGSGSSFGCFVAFDADSFNFAIDHAKMFDSKILIEPFLQDRREIECSVFFGIASYPAEVVAFADFYTTDCKMDNSKISLSLNPDLLPNVVDSVRNLSIEIFHALNLSTIARIDFFVTSSGSVFFNEVNSLPGFVAGSSLFPLMVEHCGMPFSQLVSKMIENATLHAKKS
jgi:D-alanine-D-alanine ligase